MPSKSGTYLLDIVDNIQCAFGFIEGMTYEQFRDNRLVFYAVTRCLEIISEASRRLPEEMKRSHSNIPWTDIAGAGNVYRHDYEDVQQKLIWGTVKNKLPPLLKAIQSELQN